MDIKRVWHSFRMLMITSGVKRASYLKKKHIFGSIGNDVMIQSRKVPLYPEFIFIGNNVRVASNVSFVTHDVCHHMLNNLPSIKESDKKVNEKVGKISIGDNVFIGANSIIMYDVSIGNNVIIGAGSIVTKSIPDSSVCAGVPCKVIGDFDSFVKKRLKNSSNRED